MADLLLWIVRAIVGVAGLVMIGAALQSAIRTIVVPRAVPDQITSILVRRSRLFFQSLAGPSKPYPVRDRVLALYGPVTLLFLLVAWTTIIMAGYSITYWALGVEPVLEAIRLSGSSLLTLGYATPPSTATMLLSFSEAGIGPLLIALMISYLPTIYGSFARRELLVTQLEVRAGVPASPIELIMRYHRIKGLDRMHELWPQWEAWFGEISESHTSLPILSFFRSPRPDQSWITAAGAVLDAAALMQSTIDVPASPEASLCIRSGFVALRHVASSLRIPYKANPAWQDPLSISRADFDEACERFIAGGVPVRPDRDRCWQDFAGWRTNYDTVLVMLAALVVAPPGVWSSDRPHMEIDAWRRAFKEQEAARLKATTPS